MSTDIYRFIRPLIFALPPETAHALTLLALNTAQPIGLLPNFAAGVPSTPFELMGMRLVSRLGMAAGFDKSARCIDALSALGFGFVEVGTVTPLPQLGNPRPRLFRLVEDGALINRMGFPNDGVARVCERIRSRTIRGVCGVNIGKNAATALQDATADYVSCLIGVYRYADYVAINISSPNTPELRRLQQVELLQPLLVALLEARATLEREFGRRVPILIKLAADLDEHELMDAVRVSVRSGIDGVIASNTTVRRDNLKSSRRLEEGGLSGAPLFDRAIDMVRGVRAECGSRFPIIAVGGIDSASRAVAMRAAGADLVQIYTGLIYRGPVLIRELLRAMANA